ncbi:prepilin peptidase [Halorhodospira neutriphila]|uniref:Prepilin type IV endopeptidase peptidase domain-containing protein n=1 Tax=Halorhodospira neutriphila TaxID=168379 RepID=A0ABS1E3V8_9GAMM|nr:hypothetical protein [Halorhodospira neutriphila]
MTGAQEAILPPWLEPELERLLALYDAGRLHHALLLTGRSGLGKGQLAQALARALLCEAAEGRRPCGRCRGCRRPIPARYPLVELASAAASAAVVAVTGPTPQALALLGLTWTLLAAAAIDYEHYLLPDALTLPLLWAGLLWSLLPASPLAPGDAVIGAAAGYTALWAVYHGHRLITGREGMGHGDFKLTGALGAWLGWQPLPALVLLAASGGLIAALALALRRRSLAQPLPFGPALAASGWALAVALQGGAAWPLIPAY